MRPAKSFFRLFVLCTLGLMLLWAPSHAQQLVGKSFMVRVDSKSEQATVKFANLVDQSYVAYATVYGGGELPEAEFLAIFELDKESFPRCRVTERFSSSYGWKVKTFEAHKSRRLGYFVFVFGTAGEGGTSSEELVVGHLTPACNFTPLIRREATHGCRMDRARGQAPSGEWYLICTGALLNYEVDAAGNLSVRTTQVARESVTHKSTLEARPSTRVKTEKIDLEAALSSRTPR